MKRRRVVGLVLLLTGVALIGTGAYLLYGRFTFDPQWWAESPEQERDIRAAEELVASARQVVQANESLATHLRAELDAARRAGAEKDRKAVEALEERFRPHEQKVEESRRHLSDAEQRLAHVMSVLEQRRGRWLWRGILCVSVGVTLIAAGGEQLGRKDAAIGTGNSGDGPPIRGAP